MPQLHLSVDDKTAVRIEREAKRRGLSVSKYLAMLVTADLGGTWPKGYLEGVVGSCADDPLTEHPELAIDDIELRR